MVLQRDPRNPDAQFFQAQKLIAKGKFQDAILKLRQIIDMEPDKLKTYLVLARAYLLNNAQQLAVDVLNQALKIDKKSYQARNLLINLLIKQKDYDIALDHIRILENQYPDRPAPLLMEADFHILKKDLKKAQKLYETAEKLFPNNPAVMLKMAKFFLREKKYDQAHQKIDKGLAILPTSIDLIEIKVATFLAQNKPKAAIDFCDKYIKKHSDNAYLYTLKGRILTLLKKYAQAEANYNKAIDLSPKWLQPYYKIANLYLAQGQINQGIKKFQAAVQQRPKNIRAGFTLGLLYQLNKQYKDAAQQYERVLQINNNFTPAANNLAYLYAEHLSTPENLQKALQLASQAVKDGRPETLDTLGWVQYKLKRLDEAIATLLEAYNKLEENKKNPTIAYHLATAFYKKGDKNQAKHWLKTALELNRTFPEKQQAEDMLNSL
jgi:tetratricopeptide (TPR) repeat protein